MIQGKVLFVTECLWLQGYKPRRFIVDTERIARVYRGSLRSNADSITRNLGTAEVGPLLKGLGQPAADVTSARRSGRSTVSVGKPRTAGRAAVGEMKYQELCERPRTLYG